MALAILLLFGCGSGDEIDRVVVSGTVTFNSEPVADGQIRFVPTYGSKLPVSGSAISAGKYSVTMRGGVPVGKHRIEINSYRKLEKRYSDQPEAIVPQRTTPTGKIQFSERIGAGNSEREILDAGFCADGLTRMVCQQLYASIAR